VLMGLQANVINHTPQAEISHSRRAKRADRLADMDESDTFRRNLLRLMAERGLKAAQLSKMAGLNPRAVKDIEEGRAASPKLSTVFALAQALDADPAEMMGLGARARLRQDLVAFLQQYDEADQERLLAALAALPSAPR